MSNTPPYALVIDCDSKARGLVASTLGAAGFVVAGFDQPRAALAALAARPVDLAVIASHIPGGNDGFVAARQMRHWQSDLKVLFTAAAGTRSAVAGPLDGHVVTRPFDRRRFFASVFELIARGDANDGDYRTAELGLLEAELACLVSRHAAAERNRAVSDVLDLTHRIRDARVARQAWLR